MVYPAIATGKLPAQKCRVRRLAGAVQVPVTVEVEECFADLAVSGVRLERAFEDRLGDVMAPVRYRVPGKLHGTFCTGRVDVRSAHHAGGAGHMLGKSRLGNLGGRCVRVEAVVEMFVQKVPVLLAQSCPEEGEQTPAQRPAFFTEHEEQVRQRAGDGIGIAERIREKRTANMRQQVSRIPCNALLEILQVGWFEARDREGAQQMPALGQQADFDARGIQMQIGRPFGLPGRGPE